MLYSPPVTEQRFALESAGELLGLREHGRAKTLDLIDAILEQSGTLAAEVFAPLNVIGDRAGARFENGKVTLPEGFDNAYRQYVAGGWGTLAEDREFGGQELSFSLACCVQEQFVSANMALSLLLMLSQGAAHALKLHGSMTQRERYLAKLVTGEWTGTMALTEPQAGSDVGAVRTQARHCGAGNYKVRGSKTFITFGEHNLADNIIHLVLARLPGAPSGTRGLSLFLVPKICGDGSYNDLRCVSIERKMGIHASPTCTMSFGDDDACLGELVGEENGGMKAMFSMMNHARVNVGLQGVAIGERATQAAVAFARERVQGKRLVEFPDVRRMLMTMRGNTQASRAITYLTAAALDKAAGGDPDAQALADLLTPVTKAFSTDLGVEVASTAVQVFGGAGFIEETGVAQLYRDARIAPIYEGTNGIQALDLVNRKLPAGRWRTLFKDMRAFHAGDPGPMSTALEQLETATHWIIDHPEAGAAVASPYLRMFGTVLGGYLLSAQARIAQARIAAGQGNENFLAAKIATAQFFVSNRVIAETGLASTIMIGSDMLFAVGEEDLAG